MKILILGSDGMLGHVVNKYLKQRGIEVTSTSRKNEALFYFDSMMDLDSSFKEMKDFDYVINCIGVIKPNIDENNSKSVLNAIEINAKFPHLLSRFFYKSKILQIATDCVYSGLSGNYVETALHDPTDVYGKTKSLGEVISSNFMNLRTSIIGREEKTNKSLWNWIYTQPLNSKLNGFLNHSWNGITTFAFAKILYGIISKENFMAGKTHILPKNKLNKLEILENISKFEKRSDLIILPSQATFAIDRTLETTNHDRNKILWENAGYKEIPSIEFLIEEFVDWYQ